MSQRVPIALREQVLARAGGRCAYCRSAEALLGVTFEVDHIVPQAAAGETTINNLCLSDHFAWSDDEATLVGQTPTGRATITALRMNRPVLVQMRRYWVALGLHPPV